MDFLNRWSVTMAAGGRPVLFPGTLSFPAVASADGKNSIVVLSHQLRVYFLPTRQCIRTVDVELRDAVAAHLDPENPAQLVVFTAHGHVLYVNWKEKVDQPVVARQQIEPRLELHDVFRVDDTNYYAVEDCEGTVRVHRIDRETALAEVVFEDSGAAYAISHDKSKLAVAGENVSLYDVSTIYAAGTHQSVAATREVLEGVRQITAMAVSDTGVVALGSATGAIQLVYGNGSDADRSNGNAAANTAANGTANGANILGGRSLRWHIDPVRALLFSRDGAYLVSGGAEKVLVFWHLALEKTQFLPRLGGPIDRVFVDAHRPDHYAVALSNGAEGAHEIVVVLAVDLVSRLSVAPARPNFVLARWAKRLSGRKLTAEVARQAMCNDVSAPVAVHPTTRHLYFAKGAAIQAYDIVRGEQAFVQHAAPQLATGRVRSEHKIADPAVSAVAFTPDGRWMATFDSMPTLNFDNLMLKGDTAHALKFWQQGESGWELALKIVDPHGGLAVGAVVPAPLGHSFATVDVRGGLRVWRPRNDTAKLAEKGKLAAKAPQLLPTEVWTLRRATPPAAVSAPVAACWAPDGSLLVVSHGCTMRALDPVLLVAVPFRLPALDLPIYHVAITGSHLVFALESRVVLFDMVAGRETLCAQFSAAGAANLVAVDASRDLVAVAVNYVVDAAVHAKIVLLHPTSLVPVHTALHTQAVSAVRATPSGFVFVDTDSRIGVVAPAAKKAPESADWAQQMHAILLSAQAAASVLYARAVEDNTVRDTLDVEKWQAHRTVDVALLLSVFQNLDGVGMDALFERVVRAIQ